MAKKKVYYDVTEENFEYYQGQIHRWLDFWAEKSWRVYFEHKQLKEALAAVNWDHSGKTLNVALSHKWSVQPTNKLLSKCAFHEVVEIMLVTMSRWMSGNSYDIEEAVHTVVRRLENVIFEKEWTKNAGLANE
ncbi:MAG: hypothetical protein GTO54_12900 [Nitrososphaeria archaeon]|nr:hypothetical protein [Nitrososphaeria archaeon]